MQEGSVISPSLIASGVAARPLPGLAVSGDLHLVKPFSDGVLLAAVDGIGHGDEAILAARMAVEILERHPAEPPAALVRRCHAVLRETRGVVMTLASLNPQAGTMAWLGVGNVETLLVRADPKGKPAAERVILRSGLVGYALPDLLVSVVPLAPGDLLVFVTDGIGPGFTEGWPRSGRPQQIADRIMEGHFKGTDDALVLVVRYLGSGHE